MIRLCFASLGVLMLLVVGLAGTSCSTCRQRSTKQDLLAFDFAPHMILPPEEVSAEFSYHEVHALCVDYKMAIPNTVYLLSWVDYALLDGEHIPGDADVKNIRFRFPPASGYGLYATGTVYRLLFDDAGSLKGIVSGQPAGLIRGHWGQSTRKRSTVNSD